MGLGKQLLLGLAVAIGVVVYLNLTHESRSRQYTEELFAAAGRNPDVASQPTVGALTFLSVCAGMNVTPVTKDVAVANCIGSISGFVYGFETALALADAEGHPLLRHMLWCRPNPKQMSAGDLYNAVSLWAAKYPDRVQQQVDIYGPNHPMAAQTLIIAALHEQYPCK